MKSIIKILPLVSFALAALAFSSCLSDDAFEQSVKDNEIRIEAVYPSVPTRVTGTGFEYADQIGVFVVPEGAILQPYGNAVNNGCYTYNGSKWIPTRTFYWNEGVNNVYAYYPYVEEVNDTESFPFKVSLDQKNARGYSKSDFLWAKAEGQHAGASPVSLKFSHLMSRVLVEVTKGNSYDGELPDDMTVILHNTVTTANVDLSTGGVCKDPYASAESIKMQKIADHRYAAIVVPQNITTRRPLVEIIMGEVSYLMEGMISFKQAYQHTITIVITENPQQAEINIGGGIGNWN